MQSSKAAKEGHKSFSHRGAKEAESKVFACKAAKKQRGVRIFVAEA
jgi:hypothetical protein